MPELTRSTVPDPSSRPPVHVVCAVRVGMSSPCLWGIPSSTADGQLGISEVALDGGRWLNGLRRAPPAARAREWGARLRRPLPATRPPPPRSPKTRWGAAAPTLFGRGG